MQVWPVITVLCSGAAVAISFPLIRRYESLGLRAQREAAIYSSQLTEVQADLAAGTIATQDAEQAKVEIMRRLAHAEKGAEIHRPMSSGWRSVALASTAGFLILGSINLYSFLGRPDLSAMPVPAVEQRSAAVPAQSEPEQVQASAPANQGGAGQVNDMVTRLAERLKRQPNDADGWRMLGWSYFNLQNFKQSAEAFKKALDLVPANLDYKSSYAEALVQASDGMVTPEAQLLFADVLKADPKELRARFYGALAREQAGDQNVALDQWLSLLADSPTDAGWREDVKARIANLGKATGRDVSAALALPSLPQSPQSPAINPAEKDAMVDDMIAKLAQRLGTNPKDRDGWAMMIRSLLVRGDKVGADKALTDALVIFKDDPKTIQGLQAVARGEVGKAAVTGMGTAPALPAGSAAPDLTTVDPATKSAIEAMAPSDQQQMIRSMVEKLAARLAASPDDSDGWVRLMRSYMVLNDAANASAAKEKALQAFANDPAKSQTIEAVATALGIN